MKEIFSNPLPGVPSVESPFFADLFNSSNADEETLLVARDLHERGYAVIRFPDAGFEALSEHIVSDLRPRYDWAKWRSAGSDMRIQDAWKFNSSVARIASNERILSLLKRLYGRRAWPFQTLNFPVGTQQHYHTDAIHFSSAPERFMCGVWVALEDIELDAGPLLYYPGSHRWPLYTNEHVGHTHATSDGKASQHTFHTLWQELVRVSGIEPERFLARKGDALIWAANLLHGGDAHLNREKTRWSQVTHYYFEGCSYYTPMESDPFLGSIRFRQVVDISTGKSVPNVYNDREVPDYFIHLTKPENSKGDAFDPELYLAANPDVAAAGVDPLEHYTTFGIREGRRLRP